MHSNGVCLARNSKTGQSVSQSKNLESPSFLETAVFGTDRGSACSLMHKVVLSGVSECDCVVFFFPRIQFSRQQVCLWDNSAKDLVHCSIFF